MLPVRIFREGTVLTDPHTYPPISLPLHLQPETLNDYPPETSTRNSNQKLQPETPTRNFKTSTRNQKLQKLQSSNQKLQLETRNFRNFRTSTKNLKTSIGIFNQKLQMITHPLTELLHVGSTKFQSGQSIYKPTTTHLSISPSSIRHAK